jgi:superfamily I DNA/RNA helicase
MAHILPETPPQIIPTEVLRTFRGFKNLPDTYYIWHHLAPWQKNAPDFLILCEDGRTLVVKVSPATANQTRPAAQLTLIEDEHTPLGQPETEVLQSFLNSVDLPGREIVETLIIFPNIAHKQVMESRIIRRPGEPQWAGKELLQAESGLSIGQFLPAAPLEALWFEKLHLRFAPEIVVPAEMTVRPPIERRLSAGLTDYLLDYNQEKAVKSDLDLPIEGQALTNDFHLNIINGVAGSGKTLILLYRLRLLYHLYPHKRFLVLTHNRPLNHDMQSRFTRLEGRMPDTIEWGTFNGWCNHHWPKHPEWIEPIKMKERQALIEEIRKKHLQDSSISISMLHSEIDWLKDQIPTTREKYLIVDRRGRGFGLNAEQRQRMYDAILAYQKVLEQRHAVDWGDIPQLMWQFVEHGKSELPHYDAILVDEAQFFAPLWVRLIQSSLNPQTGHLFLVADPTQGFLGRGASWKSLGLEARGRTHQLRSSYRTTREIMQFATFFYRLRITEEKDDDILAPDLLIMPEGAFPEIIPLTSPQDEIARVANEVASFVKKGYPRRHILLLHKDGHGVNSMIQAINDRLGKDAAIDPKDTYPGDYIRVTTLNAGAGLESPIVFIVGIRKLFEEEQSLRLSDTEREALIRDNTRKLYMAATRAGQRLILTYVGELPEVLEKLMETKGGE